MEDPQIITILSKLIQIVIQEQGRSDLDQSPDGVKSNLFCTPDEESEHEQSAISCEETKPQELVWKN